MLTPGVAARSTLSASAVTSGPMPSPPTTASLMVRELMPEPYWRGPLGGGGGAGGGGGGAGAGGGGAGGGGGGGGGRGAPPCRRARGEWGGPAGGGSPGF